MASGIAHLSLECLFHANQTTESTLSLPWHLKLALSHLKVLTLVDFLCKRIRSCFATSQDLFDVTTIIRVARRLLFVAQGRLCS